MSLKSKNPAPAGQQKQDSSEASTLSEDGALPPETSVVVERPRLRFSVIQWATTGVVRVFYRLWTRIAVRLFPEDSAGERIAYKLHIPLPDTLNMSWVIDQLAVGGRIKPADIPLLGRAGVTHV